MESRSWSAGSGYSFGFNGKESDNEVNGDGNQYDYGFRIYNPRLGRFLSVDPLASKFPFYSPFHFAGNKPIVALDLDGLEDVWYHKTLTAKTKTSWLKVMKVDRRTSGAIEFRRLLKKQKSIDVMYFAATTSDDGFTKVINDHEHFLKNKYVYVKQKAGVKLFDEIDDEKIKEYFKDGKKIMFIGVNTSMLEQLQTAMDEGNKKEVRRLTIKIAQTVNHEEVAHGQNALKGIEKTEGEEHKDYNGEDSHYSPTIEEIETDPKFRGTPARQQLNEIKTIVDES